MTAAASFPELSLMNRLSDDAGIMGYEIVDLAGFLDLVEKQAQDQRRALAGLSKSAENLRGANDEVSSAVSDLNRSVDDTFSDVQSCVKLMRGMGKDTRNVAEWVRSLNARTPDVAKTVQAVKKNNAQIDSIAMQVNTLAINAKIEAARAGDMGLGFAVVAEAVNELSRQTHAAAEQISNNIETLDAWVSNLSVESKKVSQQASDVLATADKTDAALSRMETSVGETRHETQRILQQSTDSTTAMNNFAPSLTALSETVVTTTKGVEEAHTRIDRLIDSSESMVQRSASLGGTTEDAPFLEFVRDAAHRLSEALDDALGTNRISRSDLFSRRYKPIPGSDPEQLMAPYTNLFDEILPPIQEPALEFDDKVVFCAAVDQNGYLPTHNRKFSQPPGDDPVWNMANCRNRRIFGDRVGLKAGRNTEPFLLQVYRRDMGGGNFVMMKDLSAPIFANGQHWGGLRFAYTF